MSPYIILLTILCYVAAISLLGHLSGRGADNMGFFIGSRGTSWWKATLAMIGAAMSGVTFISVPGAVAADGFSYMQMVIGFTIGQLIVAFVLVPLFYRHGVVSLYEWLGTRFGVMAHRAGAWCFLCAKLIGAALKIYIVCTVLQLVVFDYFKLHFIYNTTFTVFLVWLFTYRGGVRSLIVTDILQSLCLVTSVAVIIIALCGAMGMEDMAQVFDAVKVSPYSQVWFFDDALSPRYFWKMVAGGVLCLVAMTGLDQDMMQRNMSCRTMRESQINITLTALCQIVVIALLLMLGALIYIYLDSSSLATPASGDKAFPMVALQGGLPMIAGIMFILGMVSSTYSAAGSALTSLTTSFVVDIMDGMKRFDEHKLRRVRTSTHCVMALLITALILLLHSLSEGSIINLVFKIAGYTYGPILGIFVFGMVTRRRVQERYLPWIITLSPLLSGLLQWFVAMKYNYHIGFELLGYNALITIIGMWGISHQKPHSLKTK